MTALPLPDNELGGILAFYSTHHTPPEVLPDVFAEFQRTLAPGGHLMIAGHVGDDVRLRPSRRTEAIPCPTHRTYCRRLGSLLCCTKPDWSLQPVYCKSLTKEQTGRPPRSWPRSPNDRAPHLPSQPSTLSLSTTAMTSLPRRYSQNGGVDVDSEQITVKLTPDEALVLSDWLERVQMTDLSRLVDDEAVWAPIHKLAGTLDKALPGNFAADYSQQLEAARCRLRPSDPPTLRGRRH